LDLADDCDRYSADSGCGGFPIARWRELTRNPTAMEVMLARQVRHMAIPKSARKLQNTTADTPENLRDARLHFATTAQFATQRWEL